MFTPFKRKLLKTSLPIPVYNKETNNFQNQVRNLKTTQLHKLLFIVLAFLLFLLTVL